MMSEDEQVIAALLQQIREQTFQDCFVRDCKCVMHKTDYWSIVQSLAAKALRVLRGE